MTTVMMAQNPLLLIMLILKIILGRTAVVMWK